MPMILLQVNQVSKSYGANPVLEEATLRVAEKERVGLIGVNGAGKSTLLKIIASQIPPDSGEVFIAKNARIGYLAQDSGLDSERTALGRGPYGVHLPSGDGKAASPAGMADGRPGIDGR